jgi:hypothetical protein
MVGKDLTRVCLPVYFNEPLSALQVGALREGAGGKGEGPASWSERRGCCCRLRVQPHSSLPPFKPSQAPCC